MGSLALLAGCATDPSAETAETTAASERRESSAPASEAPRERPTATETAAAERRATSGGGTSAEMAKLVDQLNEAARELATLRTANAKLRAEQGRSRPAAAVEPAPKADPTDQRLAASLKSYAQFKQEMASLLAEVERLRKNTAESSGDLKTALEEARQAKATVARLEDDLRSEKRLRQEAEKNVAQLREQLRAIARAMSEAGLSAEKLKAQAEGSSSRGR